MTYPAVVLADTPLWWLQANETVGVTLADSSGNSRPGTAIDGVTLGATGARVDGDKAITLDGSSGYVKVGYAGWVAGASRTYEICYKRTGSTGDRQVLMSSSSANTIWGLETGSDITFFPNTGSAVVTWSGAHPGNGVWVYAVLRFNDAANTAELLINNVSKGLRTGIPSLAASPGNLIIGSRGDFGFAYQSFKGGLDEPAEYSGLLSDARVAAHYSALTTSPAAGRAQYNPGSGYVAKPTLWNIGGTYVEKPFYHFNGSIWVPIS